MSIKINTLEIEGVKRIKALTMTPAENGLTIIGGKNGQGKTSVLDAIAYALGGEKYRPSNLAREGDYNTPYMRVTLSNGIVAERAGKNSSLKVTDSTGRKSGQALLDSFIEELAIDLPKFLSSSNKEKAKTLLEIIGVGDKLFEMEQQEKKLYDERYQIGRIADQKEKYAKELPHYDNVPSTPVSAIDLIKRQQEILAKNGENERKRRSLSEMEKRKAHLEDNIRLLSEELTKLNTDIAIAHTDVDALVDANTEELEKDIAHIDDLNVKIRQNLDRERAYGEAESFKEKYNDLSAQIEEVRQNRLKLLEGADLPLPELSVEDGELTYKGHKWDCMSASEQLRVSVAIVQRLKPDCGFVLIDKLEQMDTETLADFAAWLEENGLQAIATRVSTGDECTIVIEEGEVSRPLENKWKEGEF